MDSSMMNQLVEWRRKLHSMPELGFEEHGTASYVAGILEDLKFEVTRGIGGTGLVATLKRGTGARCVAIRADMDALAVSEDTGLPYGSKNEGRMHACGHDGHMATALGAAALIAGDSSWSGTVRFVFQPAEEHGKGALAMLNDGLLERFPIDEIYALHNMPQLPANSIHSRNGPIMASEDNFTIHVRGKGGHSSAPHLGVDALLVGANIITLLQSVVARNLDPVQTAVISCTQMSTDGAVNVIPTNITITGDTRSYLPEVQALLEVRMRDISVNTARAHGADAEFDYRKVFSPAVNSPTPYERVMAAARAVVGDDMVEGDAAPLMASEDFGHFLSRIPGCLFFIGGRQPESDMFPLHHSKFDYLDSNLPIGAKIFHRIVLNSLSAQ